MANPEHLEILKQGVAVWNRWRVENPEVRPDFNGADLAGKNLNGSNLSSSGSSYADLRGATLIETDFSNSNLIGSNLTDADLSRANFDRTVLGRTIFGSNDLSKVLELEHARHRGPSIIGIETIYLSQGNIPESFLRGCGVPETFITFARSLIGKAINYYSVFISYSSKNADIAERLHADLQAKGVRCWFAPEDMKIGDKLRPRIDETIRIHDKLLLVLSAESITSQWVEQEVETALDKEREQGRTVLFPIRLDDTVMEIQSGWPALIKNTRHIGDFSQWKDHDAYSKAFERLLRDLKAEDKE